MSRVLVGPVRSPPATGGHLSYARESVRCTRKRDGQEARELVDMLISSRVQAVLGIRPYPAPFWYLPESDKLATSAPCPDQATHLPPKAVPIGPTSPCPGESPSETHAASPDWRVDRGSPTSRRGLQSANRSSPVEASSVGARRSGVCGHPAITRSRSASHRNVLFCR